MRMPTLLLVVLTFGLSACSTMQATPYVNSSPAYAPSTSGRVDLLYSSPQRPYVSIGTVSAKRYKPGWSDPTVSDAIPQLRSAAAQLGADAVIVRGTVPGGGTRFITVEGEAIRYTGTASAAKASDKYDQLAKLKALLDSGALSQSEYDREKAELLNGG
jgi:hypothetical protein